MRDLVRKTAESLRNGAARAGVRLRGIGTDVSGVAMIEFAFTAPIILGLGILGTETAHFVVTHMKVSQVAMQVADNASRVGEQDVLVARKVYEDDINDVFAGARRSGESIDLMARGRIILSSLQQNADGGQWIAWQRCAGEKNFTSSYGGEGDGENGTGFAGMGDAASPITASAGTAVMFVEISYDYGSVTPFELFDNREIRYTAAFNVRDQRDLSQLYPSVSGQDAATC